MCISAVLGVGSALVGASSANKAAKSQERAAQQQMDVAREQYDTTRADLAPFRQAGGNALSAYQYELGLGARPTFGGSPLEITTIPGAAGQPIGGRGEYGIPDRGTNVNWRDGGGMGAATPARYSVGGQMFDTMEAAQAYANANMTGGQQYQGIDMSPAARFALEEGRDTIEAGAVGRTGINSGATRAGLERLRFGLAAGDRDNQMNRLGGLVDLGANAARMNAANSSNFTQNATNALGGIGNAQAAGAIGFGNSLQNGLTNLASSWGYQSAQQPTSSGWVSGPMTTSLRPQARPA